MNRWYQNVPVPGAVYEGTERKESRFWNEGKWDNFIQPLLPVERRTFIDIGCNAGLMLKLAREAGFQRVIGIEGSRRAMKQAEQYRESVGGDWSLVLQVAGGGLDLKQLPLADVVLLSNMHYYIPVPDFARLVDTLRHNTLYCIVVSARVKRRGGNALYDLYSVRAYFRDWMETGVVEGVPEEGDPAPRRGMYGVSFKGGLHSQNVGSLYGWWRGECLRSKKFHFNALPAALEEFFSRVLSGEHFAYENTLLYEYWRTREPNRPPESALRRLVQKRELAENVRDNGIREPVFFDYRGNLIDGLHKLCIAKQLGYKRILVRRL
jgi:SAM-dependent methyltransferase